MKRPMRRGLWALSLAALVIGGWLAWQRPVHVLAWLSLMPFCGP